MTGIGYLGAFLGGTLALLSPCSALLLPSFFAYAFAGAVPLTRLLGRTLVFYLGLAAVLVPLGMGSAQASTLVFGHQAALTTAAGLVLIGFGLLQIAGGGFTIPGISRLQARIRGTSVLSVLALGAVSGLAGFCAGPVLGAVLTVAAGTGQPARGAALLAVYAAGMAAPLFALAAAWDRLGRTGRRWLRGRGVRLGPLRLHTFPVISGLIFTGLGVVFLRHHGTAGLAGLLAPPGLDGWDNRLQDAVTAIGARVPDVALIAAAALAVITVTAWRLARAGREARNWDAYLEVFHAERPGITEAVLRRSLLAGPDGGTDAYRWLAGAVPRAARVLDLGCGSAPLRAALAGRAYLGLDLSGAELAGASAAGAWPLLRARASAIPLADASVDVVACSMSLMVATPLPRVLAEITRVLKPGGLLAATIPAAGPLRPPDRVVAAGLLAALGRSPGYPAGSALHHLAALLTGAGLRVQGDERRRFGYRLREPADADEFLSSLYLPGLPRGRYRLARAYLRLLARLRLELPVPLRRVIAARPAGQRAHRHHDQPGPGQLPGPVPMAGQPGLHRHQEQRRRHLDHTHTNGE